MVWKDLLISHKKLFITIGVVVLLSLVYFIFKGPTGFAVFQPPINLKLIDNSGLPISGAIISILGVSGTTKEDGTVSLGKPTDGLCDAIITIDEITYPSSINCSDTQSIQTINISRPTELCVNLKDSYTQSPLSQISASIGTKSCKTDNSGICCLGKFKSKESYTVVINGNNIDTQQKTITLPEQTQPFYYSLELILKFTISVSASDQDSGETLSGVNIFLDNNLKGSTTGGKLDISSVPEGPHSLKLEYKEVTTTQSIVVTSVNLQFSFRIPVPRIVTVKVTDSDTQKNVDNIQVLLDNELKGLTGADGALIIPNVLPGTHIVKLNIPYREGVTQTFTVTKDVQVPISVKMPKPGIAISLVPGAHYFSDTTKWCVQQFSISVNNIGDGPAENTNLLVSVLNPTESGITIKSIYPVVPIGKLEPQTTYSYSGIYDIDATDPILCNPKSVIGVAIYIKENKYTAMFTPVDPWQTQLITKSVEFGVSTGMQLIKMGISS